jgi:hypothetical protein
VTKRLTSVHVLFDLNFDYDARPLCGWSKGPPCTNSIQRRPGIKQGGVVDPDCAGLCNKHHEWFMSKPCSNGKSLKCTKRVGLTSGTGQCKSCYNDDVRNEEKRNKRASETVKMPKKQPVAVQIVEHQHRAAEALVGLVDGQITPKRGVSQFLDSAAFMMAHESRASSQGIDAFGFRRASVSGAMGTPPASTRTLTLRSVDAIVVVCYTGGKKEQLTVEMKCSFVAKTEGVSSVSKLLAWYEGKAGTLKNGDTVDTVVPGKRQWWNRRASTQEL